MTAADVREAVLRLYKAAEDARAVSELPAEIGAQVTWSNGLTWERTGEDEWTPVFDLDRDAWQPNADIHAAMRAPSLHVASGTITHIEHAPVGP